MIRSITSAGRYRAHGTLRMDPKTLLAQKYPHHIALLRWAERAGYRTGVAPMSYRPQAIRVLEILDIQHQRDMVITREEVKIGKPDPQIYLSVIQESSKVWELVK